MVANFLMDSNLRQKLLPFTFAPPVFLASSVY